MILVVTKQHIQGIDKSWMDKLFILVTFKWWLLPTKTLSTKLRNIH